MRQSLISFGIVFLVLTLTIGCDKAEKEEPTIDITGEWVWVSTTYTHCAHTGDSESDIDGCADGDCDVYTFKANGTFVEDYFGDEYTGKYTIIGQNITVTFDDDDYIFKGIITLTGPKLTIRSTEPDDAGCDVEMILVKR